MSTPGNKVWIGSKALGSYKLGQANEEYRPRSDLETSVRVIGESGALGSHIQNTVIGSEVVEYVAHKNTKDRTQINNGIWNECEKNGMNKDDIRDVIFDSCTNPLP